MGFTVSSGNLFNNIAVYVNKESLKLFNKWEVDFKFQPTAELKYTFAMFSNAVCMERIEYAKEKS